MRDTKDLFLTQPTASHSANPIISFRILHTADLHGRLDWYRWLRRQAPEFDLVCIAGDLLDLGEARGLKRQIDAIGRVLRDFPAPIAICSGNHDMVPDGHSEASSLWLHGLRRRNLWIDGDQFSLGGHDFRCLGWGDPVPPAKPGEIWITHVPPDGCAASVNRCGQDYGDPELREVCRSGWGPRFALCGHIHEPRNWHDKSGTNLVLNPGHSPAAPFPNHGVVDIGHGSAELHRFFGVMETIPLGNGRLETLMAGLSDAEIEELLTKAVAELRTEGHALTKVEIDQFRQRLRAMARNQ